jgi:hypothetical protein
MFARWAKAMAVVTGMTFATLAMGCSDVDGSGIRAEDKRTVPAFHEIETHQVSLSVVVDPNAPEGELLLSGDSNLIGLVRTRVEGGRLVIDTDEGVDPRVELKIVLKTKRLNYLSAAKEADVDVTMNVAGPLTIEATSTARITARGSVDRLDAEITGSAQLIARELRAHDVKLEATGSSTASVCATWYLDVDVSGNSDASYYCDPRHVDKDVSDNSDLNHH